MKPQDYKIIGRRGQPLKTVSGYVIERARSDGEGVVAFAVRKAHRTWVVDHFGTGTSISVMGGATRKAAIQSIYDKFADFEERILRAEKFLERVNK